jgi:FkbM family methyltransferase
MESLRHLPFRHQLTRIAGLLGVRSPLRRLYRSCFAPGGGEHTLSVAGETARFYVHSKSNIEGLNSLGGERPTLEFLMRRLQRGDCVYDIGAALGLYTVFLAKSVGETGEVLAFEPEGHTYERLQEHVVLNGLANVRTFRVALGDCEAAVCLRSGEVAGSARIVPSAEPADGRHAVVERVRVAQGDRFVQIENLRLPRVVKIDVEGYEYAVIRGLSQTLAQPQCELVCCEVHPALLPVSETPEKVLDLLRSLGFRRIEIHPRIKDFHAWAFKDAQDGVPRQSSPGMRRKQCGS